MLMRFSVSNYLSFGYKTDNEGKIITEQFHMYAGKTEQFKSRVLAFEKRNVLKFASIYGANASGKSNLIKAIECGKRILLNTIEQDGMRDKYCRSKKKNRDLPTQFEYEFTVGDKCYAYGFTVNLWNKEILSEWLYELQSEKEFVIFERSVERNAYYFDEARFSDKENVNQFHYFLQDANRINTSLLLYELKRRKLVHNDYAVFLRIFDWFNTKLVIIYPETKLGKSYFRFEDNNADLVKVLEYLDTGITNYDMQPINEKAFREYFSDEEVAEHFLQKTESEEKKALKAVLRYGETLFELEYDDRHAEKISKLLFQHGGDENSYEYGEESDGTQRLIELLDIILNDEDDKVFIVDELDRSLHPQMTKKFVETFLNFSKETTAQLIITTHESNLMDLAMLRRDEIWFAEKEFDNTTTLYSLEKFKIRYDKVVAKDYLLGRYGAVPVFKDFEYVWGNEDWKD